MKYILIARVSDVEQIKALPAQKLRLLEYVQKKGVLKKDYTYHEFNETAHEDIRKKFSKLVQHIQAQKERTIVVFDKIDRFTRDSSQEEVKALNLLVKLDKIELHFPHDALFIDKESSASDLFRLGIGMALAKYYSDSIRDNVKRRFDQMLNDKTWIGYAPLGYKNIVEEVKGKQVKDIAVDSTRANHVINIFELRALGMPYEQIAKQVTRDGLLTKKGNKLTKATIEKISRNPFYYGRMLYMGKEYDHKYEPLITRALFNQCQAVRVKRHDRHTAYNSLPFTFKGIVTCKGCGGTISSFYARDNVYMTCSGKTPGCKNTPEKKLLPGILDLIASIRIPSETVPLIINELKRRHDNQQLYYSNGIQVTRKEYDKTATRLKKLTYERLDGKIGSELYDDLVTELTSKQDELNDKLEKLTNSNKSFLVTASYLLDLAQRAQELFNNSHEELRQKLLGFLLSNIELYDGKLSYTVNEPYKSFIEANKKAHIEPVSKNWCGSGDSNPWPRPWQGRALNN
jgi:site-specific DNA recombinase